MLGVHRHTPYTTEIGGFWGASAKNLAEAEAKIKTRFAFATTASQAGADAVLSAGGWTDCGHRYNQYHGPRFVTLWMKAFPANKKPVAGKQHYPGSVCYGANPPYGQFGCGFWFAQHTFAQAPANLLKTKYLAIWELKELPKLNERKLLRSAGWKPFSANLWYAARPHDWNDREGGHEGW